MIKAVLFDFGGVLTEGGKKGFIAETLAELYGRTVQLDIGDLHHMMCSGQGAEESFFTELNKKYQGSVTKEMFLRRAGSYTTPTEQVYLLAKKLLARGIKTGILSNVFAMSAEELRRQGRYDGFDPVVLSCEEGYAKPDEEFYRTAIERSGVRSDEILFIDDQEMCMPAARKLGMHTIRAVTPQQIVDDTTALIRKLNNIDL